MRTVVHKLFWIWDYEKEEKWLNEMAAKGFGLISVGFLTYEFETTLPGEYHVRMQIMEHLLQHPETAHYIHFLEETGVQHVGTFGRQAYFRKKTADGSFDLFSDGVSRIKPMKYLISLLAVLICLNIYSASMNIYAFVLVRHPANLFAALMNFLMIGLLSTGIIKLCRIKKKIKDDQRIFE